MRKQAFTICEVLIVLGILGLIAEMTLPSLINNVQETIWKTSAKVAYSKLSQVISLLRLDEGELTYYYTDNSGTLRPALMHYFKVLKDCGNELCVPGEFYSNIYKSLTGDPADTLNMGNDGQFITVDGMFFNIQQPNGPGTGAAVTLEDGTNLIALDPLSIIIDVNGFNKKPNVFGKDTFAFQLLNDEVLPMGAPNTACPAVQYCNKSNHDNRQGLGCMYYVMQGIDY